LKLHSGRIHCTRENKWRFVGQRHDDALLSVIGHPPIAGEVEDICRICIDENIDAPLNHFLFHLAETSSVFRAREQLHAFDLLILAHDG
jgi:hypothetical protein